MEKTFRNTLIKVSVISYYIWKLLLVAEISIRISNDVGVQVGNYVAK